MPDPQEALELEARRRIYQFLERSPGEHMREIGRTLEIPMGTLEYHLHYLVKAGLLTTRQDARFTRYFVVGGMGREEKDVLAVLRQKVPRQIAAYLLLHPDATHGEILTQFALSASTLSFHLKKLTKSAIASQTKDGRENKYRIVQPDLVARVLIKYRSTFLDDVVDRFAEAWMSLAPRPDELPVTPLERPPSAEGGSKSPQITSPTAPPPQDQGDERAQGGTQRGARRESRGLFARCLGACKRSFVARRAARRGAERATPARGLSLVDV
ncbi:MAG: winged helix-turn-helix transcriptional regulator [Thermoplasmatota archaeon]